MSRLIDADEYRKCLIDHMTVPWERAKYDISDDYNKGLYDAVRLLNAEPTIQPESHWIPCSEGLPKEEGFYLVTLGYKHGAETNIRYFKIENGTRYWSRWGNENITAWTPKPEPYKGVTDGND